MPTVVERFNSGGRPVTVEIVQPASAGRHPAALILHGTSALLPDHRSEVMTFAEALADRGIAAVIPHYFERTGTPAGIDVSAASPQLLRDWTTVCEDALVFTRRHPAIDAGRLGLIGFSLGGYLAMNLAMSPHVGTSLKCVVEFFAPTRAPRLYGDRELLPPILIHHGTSDTVVPIEDSIGLVTELRAAGRVEGLGYTFIRYEGEGHGFKGASLESSRNTTVAFIGEVV